MDTYSETDVRTSFVSFADHLPSEIIRKLWLIQTLDISYNALKDELKSKLSKLDHEDLPKDQFRDLSREFMDISSKLKNIRDESLVEANSIRASIKIAKLKLDNQHKQLEHDHKLYQNEIEMRTNLSKHAQRSNKRTSTRNPKIKLKLKPNTPEVSRIKLTRSLSPSKVTKEVTTDTLRRGRGRPKKYQLPILDVEVGSKKKFSLKIKQEINKQLKQQIKYNEKQQSKIQARSQESQEAKVIQIEEDEEICCTCDGPAYGDMVACDNEKCPKEWFHYDCVGLVKAPGGKWYCPLCIKSTSSTMIITTTKTTTTTTTMKKKKKKKKK